MFSEVGSGEAEGAGVSSGMNVGSAEGTSLRPGNIGLAVGFAPGVAAASFSLSSRECPAGSSFACSRPLPVGRKAMRPPTIARHRNTAT